MSPRHLPGACYLVMAHGEVPGLPYRGRGGWCRSGQVRQAVVMTLGTRPRQRLTLAVACMAQGMMVLDVLIVSVALPAMQRELHLSPAGLEWVVSGYALALAALIPTGGALGDHFGRKRIFVSGVTLFTLASVGCALSVSGAMLVGFRVIQGIGGAVMSSLTLSLISEAYPPEAGPARSGCGPR